MPGFPPSQNHSDHLLSNNEYRGKQSAIGILENNREKEEDLVARISRVIGIDRIPGSDRPPCRSIMFRTGRDACAYQNREVKSQSSVQTLRRSKPVQSYLDITSENEYKTIIWDVRLRLLFY